jgi:hypothetical protein
VDAKEGQMHAMANNPLLVAGELSDHYNQKNIQEVLGGTN